MALRYLASHLALSRKRENKQVIVSDSAWRWPSSFKCPETVPARGARSDLVFVAFKGRPNRE
eukprot:2922928-Pleurochrysis_carterae.AAC.2